MLSIHAKKTKLKGPAKIKVMTDKQNHSYNPRFPSSFTKNLALYLRSEKSPIEYGTCSYYHNLFHKRKTATGDIFDQWTWTAAHQTLPIPCIILVCYLDKSKQLKGAIILVNDRGPYVNNRILDVSYSLAKTMDLVKRGHMKVAIFFLRTETMKLFLNSKYEPKYKGLLNAEQIREILNSN